ncbi:MAG: phytanoyl-CoA dioxygenase family protein [Crocinitomix sp.]|nr:phytanoyl-CoA dioxygenase family protein [Crocinitomix sp.]
MDKSLTLESILIDTRANKELAENGYTIFPMLSPADIENLTNYYSEFQQEDPKHFYASTHSPDFAFRKKTSDFIKEIVEPHVKNILFNYKLLGGSYVVKPANGKGILQAHQDWNLVDEEKNRSYNLWIPLVDVNIENGAVFVLSGSHTKNKSYRGPGIPSPFKNIEQKLWKYLTPLPMKAGEALLYDHALLHGSPSNQTANARLGVVIGIVKEGVDLQIFGNDKGIIKTYRCDENFFLSKNTLTDFVELPVKSTISESQKEITLGEFLETYMNSKSDTKNHAPQEASYTDKRTFFEKYTLKNILAEANYRLFPKTTLQPKSEEQEIETPTKKDVAKFYNVQTDNFLKVYGKVIQAFRTKNVNTLLDYQINAIGLMPGIKALDAGCGVCGPAVYFAQHSKSTIEAITISSVQVEKAKKNIEEANVADKVKVTEGDYHSLEKYYPANSFDCIYFLESFGHAHNHLKVLDSAWNVLKPGGMIYIKDLFRKIATKPGMEAGIEKEIQNINNAYHYNVPELNSILDFVRGKGYILSSLKTIDIPLEEFENLTISNDFQELTGINKIENLREYVFPVDFFELKIIKPNIDIGFGNSRYFLQNMYFMQMENWKEREL